MSCTSITGPATEEGKQSQNGSGAGTDGEIVGNQTALAQDRDDIIVPRACTLSQLLNFVCPDWQRWQGVPNVNGDGIWSIPERIESGLCNIYVNGVMVLGSNVNVDTIQLQERDVLAIRPV